MSSASSDYVIVGAGSAGCVLANRLSEDPDVRVTLLEAGGRGLHLNIAIPAAFGAVPHEALDWDQRLEPESHSARAVRCTCPAARAWAAPAG